jgi:hypothetical protein
MAMLNKDLSAFLNLLDMQPFHSLPIFFYLEASEEVVDGHARFVSPELEKKILEDFEAAGKVEEDALQKTYAGKSFFFREAKTPSFPGIDVLDYPECDSDDDEGEDMYFEDEFEDEDE